MTTQTTTTVLNDMQCATLARNVRAWIDGTYAERDDEGHILALLRNFGVITCAQEDRAWFEPQSREHDVVHIFIDDDVLEVTPAGEVSWF